MSDLFDTGFEPGAGSQALQVGKETLQKLPGWAGGKSVGKLADFLITPLQNENFRKFEAAQDTVIAQIIRAETGAGGGEGPGFVESMNKRYRITANDTPAVAQQKLKAMRDYMATIGQAAGSVPGLTSLKPLATIGKTAPFSAAPSIADQWRAFGR